MKICMFTNTYLPHLGGVARSVSGFADDLQQKGHEVMVIAPTFEGAAVTDLNDSRVVRVPAIQNFNGSDFSVRILMPGRFRRKIESFDPDIIHSHHPFLLGDAALRTARQRGVPLVFTHHTQYERYTHYVPFDSPVMQRFVVKLATRFANLCQAVIAPSTSIRELLLERGVTTPSRIVPTGIDTDFFSSGNGERFRNKWMIDRSAFVFGHLGRLAPEKNLPYLSKAVLEAIRKHGNGMFLVAGDGPSQKIIARRFAEAGLENRLVLTGSLKGEELRDCYAAMDLFVFASTSETQGMVLTEAMAAGRPVIALDAPGVREVVVDRENGLLLPSGTEPEVFARELMFASTDARTLAAWKSAALETARHFSRSICLERLETVYLEAFESYSGSTVNELDTWDSLLESLHAEWDLASSKVAAVWASVGSEKRVPLVNVLPPGI